MKNNGTKTLETNRLLLKKFELSDAESIFNDLTSDKETTKTVSWTAHKNVNQTVNYIKSKLDKYSEDTFYDWVVVKKDTDEAIGEISIGKCEIKNETCEAGYC